MKISEFIDALTKIQSEHGDLDVIAPDVDRDYFEAEIEVTDHTRAYYREPETRRYLGDYRKAVAISG